MVRSSLFVATVLATIGFVLPTAVLAQGIAQQVIGDGSGIAPPHPPPSAIPPSANPPSANPPSANPSTSLTACPPKATTCGARVPTTVTHYNGTITTTNLRTHKENMTVTHMIKSTSVVIKRIPETEKVVFCPNETTTSLPIPSLVEIVVDYTSTDTFITTSISVTKVTTYVVENAVSACYESTYNILAATVAAKPTPGGGADADRNRSHNSNVASAAAVVTAPAATPASDEPDIDINEAEADAIPEPASVGWRY